MTLHYFYFMSKAFDKSIIKLSVLSIGPLCDVHLHKFFTCLGINKTCLNQSQTVPNNCLKKHFYLGL